MISLKDVCYEQIKDNYWYGLFGAFKLVIDKNTGYFNATRLCKDGAKRFHKWLENKQTQDLINYLSGKSKFSVHRIRGNGTIRKLFYEIHLKQNEVHKKIRGTYVSEDLITYIACWISSKFNVKVNKIVKDTRCYAC